MPFGVCVVCPGNLGHRPVSVFSVNRSTGRTLRVLTCACKSPSPLDRFTGRICRFIGRFGCSPVAVCRSLVPAVRSFGAFGRRDRPPGGRNWPGGGATARAPALGGQLFERHGASLRAQAESFARVMRVGPGLAHEAGVPGGAVLFRPARRLAATRATCARGALSNARCSVAALLVSRSRRGAEPNQPAPVT
jgi:hypothetical protein